MWSWLLSKPAGYPGWGCQAQMLTDWVFLEILQLRTPHARQKPETHFSSVPGMQGTLPGMQADSWGSPVRCPLMKLVTRRGERHVKPAMAHVMAETRSQGQLQHGRPVQVRGWPPRQLWDGIRVTFLTPDSPPSPRVCELRSIS